MTRRWLIAVALVMGGCAPAATSPPPVNVPAPINVPALADAEEPATKPCDGEPDAPAAIPWEDAVVMIETARVRAIYQNHCLEVRLDTLDGESYLTLEPALDEVFKVADAAPNGDKIIRTTD